MSDSPAPTRPAFIFSPLARRPLALLWVGQVLSAVGDEFYAVAVLWVGVDLIGTDAGYINAVQAFAVLLVSLFGGIWADRWDHRRAMMGTDLVRGIVVLLIPAAALMGVLSLWILIPVALVVSGLNAIFEPALQASLPRIAGDLRLLNATNGLFDGTRRLARIAGPGLIGALAGLVPVLGFFLVESASFLISALVLSRLAKELPPIGGATRLAPLVALSNGFRTLRKDLTTRFGLMSSAITNMSWSGGLLFGMAMLLRETEPEPLRAYGLLIAVYGCGNVAATLVLGSMTVTRPLLRIAGAKLLFGVGLIGMALAPDQHTRMAIAFVTAWNGPLGDLALLQLMQTRFTLEEIPPVYRTRMFFGWAGMMVGYLAAPPMFENLPAWAAISALGLVGIVVGIVGLIRTRDPRYA